MAGSFKQELQPCPPGADTPQSRGCGPRQATAGEMRYRPRAVGGMRKEALRLTCSWEEEQAEGPKNNLSFRHTEF